MSAQSIQRKLEGLGFESKIHPRSNRGVIVYFGETKEERIEFLKEKIAPAVEGTWRAITQLKSASGAVNTKEGVMIVAFPIADINGSLASLDSNLFSKLGKKTSFCFMDKTVKCIEFTSAEHIINSIKHGVKNINFLSDELIESFTKLNESPSTIEWAPSTTVAEKNKLGVYVGELLAGLVALNSPQYRRKHLEKNIFGTKKAKSFLIPTDLFFSGVDSFVRMEDDTIIPISSKFGAGAKASIFTNLMVVAMEKRLTKSHLRDFINIIKKEGVKATNSSACVYAFGIRHILGIPKNKIKNPLSVYNQIRNNKIGKEAELALEAIKTIDLPNNVKTNFKPENMSYVFNMALADFLSDEESLKQITNILSGKQYWQMSLNKPKWSSGEITFKVVQSGKATVKLFGNKSVANDITAKQGWVNYELKVT